MIKKYWPIALTVFLFQFVPIVMRHTRFEKYLTAYLYILVGLEVLFLIAAIFVWRNRRKAQQPMP